MKRSLLFSSILIFLFSLLLSEDVLSWDDGVIHKDLSEYAAKKSILRFCNSTQDKKCDYLKNLGLNSGVDEVFAWEGKKWTVTKWLQRGAELEDSSDWGFPFGLGTTTRSYNHFHNPLKPWDQAGLNDTWTGKSSLLWAQDGSYQQGFPGGDWSWKKVREYFYTALTGLGFSGSIIAPTKEKREEFFAMAFRGLGHQMHLLQDMTVPDHVRNDAHPEDSILSKVGILLFKNWTKEKPSYKNTEA